MSVILCLARSPPSPRRRPRPSRRRGTRASAKSRRQKEQAIYGRVFHNLAEVRAAVAAFVKRYNQCWRLEKLAYRTPLEAREEYELRHAA